MKTIRRILVALDLAPKGQALTTGSRLALEQALRFAPALEAQVLLFHSTAADEAWDDSGQEYVDVPERSGDALAPAIEEALQRTRAAGLQTDTASSPEPAAIAIIRRVLKDEIDLVISGKRNEPDRRGRRIGSVSTKLLRKCPCAVWVVKPESDPVPQRILAATDLTPVGEQVIGYAAFLADHCDAELHVVNAFQRPLAIQLEGEEASAQFERLQRKERREKIEAQLADAKCTREVDIHIGLTSPSRAIMACDERITPDLVVMGTVSRGGVAGLLVGNTAERLLGHLDCSLLTVKPDDFVCPVTLD